MISIIKKSFISFTDERKSSIIAEIYADDVSELPEKDGFDGYELAQGSVAYVIKSGGFYILGGDGKWYSLEDGTPAEVVTETEAKNESAQDFSNQ